MKISKARIILLILFIIIMIPVVVLLIITYAFHITPTHLKFTMPDSGIVNIADRSYDLNKIGTISSGDIQDLAEDSGELEGVNLVLRDKYGWGEKPETLMRTLRIELDKDVILGGRGGTNFYPKAGGAIFEQNISHTVFNGWFRYYFSGHYFVENNLERLEKCKQSSCYIWDVHLSTPEIKEELLEIAWKISQEDIVKDVRFIGNASLYTTTPEKIGAVPETGIVKIGNSEYDLDKIGEIQPIKTIGEGFFYDYGGYGYSQEYNYEKQIYETTPQEEKDFHAKGYPLSFGASVYYPMEDKNFSNYNNIYITFHKHKIFNDGSDGWSKIKFHNWFQKFHLDYVVMSRGTNNCEGKSCESWNIYLPTATKNQVTKFLMEINQEDIVKSAGANINEFGE